MGIQKTPPSKHTIFPGRTFTWNLFEPVLHARYSTPSSKNARKIGIASTVDLPVQILSKHLV
jgi:hypothetical protein